MRWFVFSAFLSAGLGLLTMTPPAGACPVRARVYYPPVVVHKPVVAQVVKVIEKAVIPVAVFAPVPAYGAVYAPPAAAYPPPPNGNGGPAAAPNGNGELGAVLQELRRMNGRLDALEKRVNGGPAGPPEKMHAPGNGGEAKDAPLPDALQVYNAKCAACHLAGKEKDGGGFVLLKSPTERAPITFRQAQLLVRHCTANTMPPPRNRLGIQPLSEAEFTAAMNDVPNFAQKPEE